MIDAFVASISTTVLLSIVGWLARTWIKEKLTASLKLETDSKLEELKSIYAKQVSLTESRAKAYRELWMKTKIFSPSTLDFIDKTQIKSTLDDLKKWYYDDGNAMHLSLFTTNDLLKGMRYLELELTEENIKILKMIFSSMRTRIKEDLGIYTSKDVQVKIPNFELPLADGKTKVPEPNQENV